MTRLRLRRLHARSAVPFVLLLTGCGAAPAVPGPLPECQTELPATCPYGIELTYGGATVEPKHSKSTIVHRTAWPEGALPRGAPARVEARGAERYLIVDGKTLFAPFGAADGEHVTVAEPSENGDLFVAVGASRRAKWEADLVLTALRSDGRVVAPALLLGAPDPGHMNWLQHVVPAGEGRFIVLWQRQGKYRASSLEVAVVEVTATNPRVVSRRTLAPSIYIADHDLVATPDGAVFLYGTGEQTEREAEGVWAMWLDREGAIRGHERILAIHDPDSDQPPQWNQQHPRAAWDGEGVAVVVGWGGLLVYLRLGDPGEVRTKPVVIDGPDDWQASFSSVGVAAAGGRAWVVADESFYRGLLAKKPGEMHAVFVEPDGRHSTPIAFPADRLRRRVEVFADGDKARGVVTRYRDEDSLSTRAFTLSCRQAPPPPSPPRAPSPCDLVERPFEAPRFAALRRGTFTAIPYEADWIVASVEPHSILGKRAATLLVSRMGPDGSTRWTTRVHEGFAAGLSLAARFGEVAVLFAGEAAEGGARPPPSLVTLDVTTGRVRETRHRGAGGESGCVAVLDDGYLLALSGGKKGRTVHSRGERTDVVLSIAMGWAACSMARTTHGFMLAFNTDQWGGEATTLVTLALDASGTPASYPRPFWDADVRDPIVASAGERTVVVWTGPFSRGLYAIDLRDDGSPIDAPRTLVDSHGLTGYGFGARDGALHALVASTMRAGTLALCPAGSEPPPAFLTSPPQGRRARAACPR